MKILSSTLIFFVFFTSLSCTFKSPDVSAKSNLPTDNFNQSNSAADNSASQQEEQLKQSGTTSQTEKFKIAPKEFKQIDFKNYSYSYKFYNGRKTNITLKDGEFEYDFKEDKGWFSLSEVYYVDLTNDTKAEAIVLLWNVSCGVSCDGGSALFYIYTIKQNQLKSLWQFETGSLAYGCGLKSFTVRNKKLQLELFGNCNDKMNDSSSLGKFQVKDTTQMTFAFNGAKFIAEKKEAAFAPERNVMNYNPQIIIEDQQQ